jgi:hypothetical protein
MENSEMLELGQHSYWGYVITLFGGALIGAAVTYFGTYHADQSTDRRRERESKEGAKDKFREIRRDMPELIAGLKNWLEKYPTIREFVVVPNKNIMGPSGIPGFVETEMPGVTDHAAALANAGHIDQITGRFPRYRMAEEFVTFVKSS